jgi:hypothetical protein
MDPNDPDFSENTLKVGRELIKGNQAQRGVMFLTQSFNSATSEVDREVILKEIMKLDKRDRSHFVQAAQFKNREIPEEILSEILELPESQAAGKLIKARKFDCNCDFGQGQYSLLFRAVSSSMNGYHDQAKMYFRQLTDLSVIRSLDLDLLWTISRDLSPQVLVQIGKPELQNDDWSVSERKASFHFLNGDVSAALEIAAANMQDSWHFEEWPKVPLLLDWVEGGKMMHFAAGIASEYRIEESFPLVFDTLVKGVSLARNCRFKEALDVLGDDIYVFEFLRHFALASAHWIMAIEQIEDEDIRKCAVHYLISNSPKKDYRRAVAKCPDVPGLRFTVDELNRADLDLMTAVEQVSK